MPNVLRRINALGALRGLLGCNARRLSLVTSGLRQIDTYGGLVLRSAIDAHVGADRHNTVVLHEPLTDDVWDVTSDLLGALPKRCKANGDADAPRRSPRVLVPAMAVTEASDVPLIAELITRAAPPMFGLNQTRTNMLGLAAAILGENQVAHCSRPQIAPMLSCASDPEANDVQLTALDLGQGLSKVENHTEELKALVARSRKSGGGFDMLMNLATRRKVELTLRLASGRARAAWRTSSDRFSYGEADEVPGFAASVEIHM